MKLSSTWRKSPTPLGAKTVLWELFSFNPPMLKLYVDLCSWSQFLSEILINNPGMIDELLDSLVLNTSAGRPWSRLRELRIFAELLSRVPTTPNRSCTASATRNCSASASATSSAKTRSARLHDGPERFGKRPEKLVRVAEPQSAPLERRYGVPTLAEGPRAGEPARFALLAAPESWAAAS